MTDRILIMATLGIGLGLSIVTPSPISPRSAKSMAWFIAGILSNFNNE